MWANACKWCNLVVGERRENTLVNSIPCSVYIRIGRPFIRRISSERGKCHALILQVRYCRSCHAVSNGDYSRFRGEAHRMRRVPRSTERKSIPISASITKRKICLKLPKCSWLWRNIEKLMTLFGVPLWPEVKQSWQSWPPLNCLLKERCLPLHQDGHSEPY